MPPTDDDIIALLWETMDVRELVLSLSTSGFFPHEPVMVTKEDGRLVVIEGNRRLAAAKLLCDPHLAERLGADVPPIDSKTKAKIEKIPTVSTSRENAWQYLGFKHVNGPAKWSSYAKSKYVATVHRQYGIPLTSIANQIGDTHRTVQRLYRGLMVIEQAEKERLFDRNDRWRNHFAFSHLYTGLDYRGISEFIGVSDASDEIPDPVPTTRKCELRELFLWIYGSKREDREPVVQRQNPDLRRLDVVVSHEVSLAALRSNVDLAVAFEMTVPTANLFIESLANARNSLQKARGLLESYGGSEEQLRTAGTIAVIAEEIYDEMDRKRNRTVKKRLTETNY